MSTDPRLLVTGFGPFPGEPVNPSGRLALELREAPPAGLAAECFRAELLDVDYAGIGPQLSEIARDFSPDIAIHFGLARECSGFRLEKIAKNRADPIRPDNRGMLPEAGPLFDGPAILPSRLPLQSLARDLEGAGFPVEWSEDAGDYLCNAVMALSVGHVCEGLKPAMSGFVHVPPTTGEGGPMAFDELLAGARIIISTCLDHWR